MDKNLEKSILLINLIKISFKACNTFERNLSKTMSKIEYSLQQNFITDESRNLNVFLSKFHLQALLDRLFKFNKTVLSVQI